jgi:hypothetical protein
MVLAYAQNYCHSLVYENLASNCAWRGHSVYKKLSRATVWHFFKRKYINFGLQINTFAYPY